MKRSLLLAIGLCFLISPHFTTAQSNDRCAFDRILQSKKSDPVYQAIRAQTEAFIRNYTPEKNDATIKIPCVVHIIHTGQAAGTGTAMGANPNDAQINSAIADMTAAFTHTGFYANRPAYSATVDVEFVLAKTAPDGSATTGILRYDVSGETWGSTYANQGMDAGQTPGVPQATITAGKFWPPTDYMNIWVVHEVEDATSTLGFASFPQANPGSTDGLTMLASAFGFDPENDDGFLLDPATNLNGTANHEIGHYLNLYHTFTGDNEGAQCPADQTCGEDSDCCPDIPPHKRSSGCPADGNVNECTSNGPNTYIHNFMDYADDACFHGFSNDQKTRMDATLAGQRIALSQSIGDDAPAANYPAATTAPSVTNMDQTMGIYDVNIGGTTYKSWGSMHDGGYLNRVASQPRTNFNFNQSVSMTVQVGVGNTSNAELVNVYVDYNNDGDFTDAGENVYTTPGGSGKMNGDVFSINFTTPNEGGSTPAGQALRLRIVSDFDTGTALSSPTTVSQGGQIEDYSIVLDPATPIIEPETARSLNIYPNPANQTVNLDIPASTGELYLKVIDITGRTIVTQTIDAGIRQYSLNTSQLPTGHYVLTLTDGHHMIADKLVIYR